MDGIVKQKRKPKNAIPPISEAFAKIFNSRMINSTVHELIPSLLYTLSNHGLLDTALHDISNLLGYTIKDTQKLQYVRSMTSLTEAICLQNNPKALQLVLLLYPHIVTTDSVSTVTIDEHQLLDVINRKHPPHVRGELKKMLVAINNSKLNYKILQRPRVSLINEFVIVKYTSKDDLLDKLTAHKLLSPGILDKVIS